MNGAWQQAFDLKYDLAGNITDFTYPDGLHIQQAWDGAGHLSNSNLVDINGVSTSQGYLQSATYHPDGSPYMLTLGNGVQQAVDENNRLQIQSMVASSPLAPFNSHPFLSHTYCYVNCSTGGTHNNGNIWGITDTLNPSLTQGFTYDSLNRINSFSVGGAISQQYKVDSFGNMSPMSGATPVHTFDPVTNRINNLPCASSVPSPYDASGNQICDTDSSGAARTYAFDAEGHVTQITMVGGGTPFETYIYDGFGDRVSKANANGTFTEYVYFNGQPMAEKDQTGAWTDYIHANGKKIASVPSTELRIHAHGNNTVGTFTAMGFPLNRVIQSGDHLAWRQYDAGSSVDAGIYVGFTDGTTTLQQVADDHGQAAEGGGTVGAWDLRVVDLSAFAGKTANEFALMSGWQSLGIWDVWYADIALYGADGSVTQLFNNQPIPMNNLYVSHPSDQTEGQMCLEQGSSCVTSSTAQPTNSRTAAIHYYLSDHLGSTQMEMSIGGWPVWKGQFAPFGQELDTQFTANHYKFTGLEHDSESGLDHTQFRQYGSTMGRWMSPDPYNGSMDPSNPQSFNRYSYVGNSPLTFNDLTGLSPFTCTPPAPSIIDGVATIGACAGTFICGPLCGVVVGSISAGLAVIGEAIFGGWFAPQFHGILKPRPNVNCSQPPPNAPKSPPGVNLAQNVQQASTMNGAQWLNKVKPFGDWDYAHTVGQQYGAFGNFNYGSTCAAQGLSLIGCQQGAGLAAYGTASKNVLGGGPWTAGPGNLINPATANGLSDYGDQSIPSENPSVINGYNAQIWHQVCHQ